MKKRAFQAGLLLLPTLVLTGWMLQVASAIAAYPAMRINLLGYDPRDLLQGHYLMVVLDIEGMTRAAPDCVCLVERPKAPGRPGFKPLPSCAPDALRNCPMPLKNPTRNHRYYRSEQQAKALEKLLADGRHVDALVRFDGKGGVVLDDLRVDGETPP